MADNFMDFIDEIIELRKLENEIIPKFSDEIMMWRQKFLNQLPIYQDEESVAKIWHCFLSASSERMLKDGPDQYLKDIEKIFKE
jgi:hypothetical protein